MLMMMWFVMMEAMMADYNVIIYTRWWITMGARTPAQPAYLGANIKKKKIVEINRREMS